VKIFRYRSAVIAIAHHDETAALAGELIASDQSGLELARSKERYICSRAMLRRLLRENGQSNEAAAELRRTAAGRPMLAEGSWFVSFSHADPWSIAAIALQPVGVDIERCDRRVDWESIAAMQLPPTAAERLKQTRPGKQRETFLREWTRIEASAKQSGRGVSLPVLETDFSPDCAHFVTEELIGCIAVPQLDTSKTVVSGSSARSPERRTADISTR